MIPLDISFETLNHAGIITLNTASTLNAITADMVAKVDAQLTVWEGDPDISHILLQSHVLGCFSSGGNLKHIYAHHKAGASDQIFSFLEKSYALNLRLHHSPKPIISIVDGLCLGGGMGLALNGQFCVYTDNASFAMPEVYIGFFPDVGARFFLRSTRDFSLFLGMTGYRMTASDMYHTGICKNYVHKKDIDSLVQALKQVDLRGSPREGVAAVIDLFRQPPESSSFLADSETEIQTVQEEDDPTMIASLLNLSKKSGIKRLGAEMSAASPLSLCVTHHIFREKKPNTLLTALEKDLQLAQKLFDVEEPIRGIEGRIIHKKSPQWGYPSFDTLPDDVFKFLQDE